LTNCEIDIIDEKDEKNKRNEEVKKISETFMSELNVDEVIAHLLATEGFASIEEIANSEDTDFKSIEGFDENIINDLKERAIQNVGKQNKELEKKKAELNISKDLEDIKKFNLTELIKLGENNIKNLDQLADLSSDELIEIFENKLKRKDADEIIMKARENWFKEDKKKN
jgi:N utilization substance protein A